jgi:serine/threonine-protein kinase HipA
MTTLAEVKLWERTIGAVSLEDGENTASFQYDPDLVNSKIELSPVTMPLSNKVYSFPELPYQSFRGLPGLLSDSLPDRFGNLLINEWLARQGRTADSFNAVERLCYTGRRGMGALEYNPILGPESPADNEIQVEVLVNLASEILSRRNSLQVNISNKNNVDALKEILRVGTSAGGARAKAIIAWNEKTGEVRSGQISAGSGFRYWLLKFDGVRGNKDKELEDPKGCGAIEYAYYLIAQKAGIEMNECRLLEENGRRHFMAKRFDRSDSGEKLHMLSLGAMAHFDFNTAGAYSYEQAFQVIRQLGLSVDSVEELFRRMVFNIIARNQDDHVKNIAFLMDKSGKWQLSPAFDMTYSYNPLGDWTSVHQMSMNGKRDTFSLEDFRECAKSAVMKRGKADMIIDQVQKAANLWPETANEVHIPEDTINKIHKTFRSFLT